MHEETSKIIGVYEEIAEVADQPPKIDKLIEAAMEQERSDTDQAEQEKDGSRRQKNMDTIDENEELSTEDESPRGSYQNTEELRLSRLLKQPSARYDYGKHIHMLVDYTQHSLKKVLKLFKEKVIQALHKEINQLDCRDVVEPTRPEDITKKDENTALQYLMFL